MAAKERKKTPLGHQLVNLLAEIPDLAIETAIERCLTPPRQKTTPSQSKVLSQAVSASITVNGVKFQTYAFSPPELSNTSENKSRNANVKGTIILTHGFGMSGISMLGFVPPILKAGHRALIYDHNGSSSASSRRKFDFELAQDTTAAILQDPQNQPVTGLISFSAGATITLSTLASRPDVVASIQNGSSRSKIKVVCMAPPLQRSTVLDPFLAYHGLSRSQRRIICDGAGQVARRKGWMMPEDLRSLIEQNEQRLKAGIDGLMVYDRDDKIVGIDEVRWVNGVIGIGAEDVVFTNGLGHYGCLRDDKVIEAAVGFIVGQASLRGNADTNLDGSRGRSKI